MHHQDALAKVASQLPMGERGGRHFIAVLRTEPTNPHDPNAVSIWAGTEQIGYLTREDAAKFHDIVVAIETEGHALWCDAMIVGGVEGRSFGLRVGFTRPTRREREAGLRP